MVSPMSNEIPEIAIRTELTPVTASERTIPHFRAVEGPTLIGVDASVSPTGKTLHGIRLPDGTVCWEHGNPVEFQREYEKMESDDW